jgi:hypothetical protein
MTSICLPPFRAIGRAIFAIRDLGSIRQLFEEFMRPLFVLVQVSSDWEHEKANSPSLLLDHLFYSQNQQ